MHLSVVIVDDNIEFLAAAASMLEGEGVTVCAAAQGFEDALAAIDHWVPNYVLIDVNLAAEDGFALAALVLDRQPSACVVMISSRSPETYTTRLSAVSGVRGFISKDDLCAESILRFSERPEPRDGAVAGA